MLGFGVSSLTRHQSSRSTKQRDKTAEHRTEGEPSGESVEHTTARTSSQGTDLHGWMLTKRFLGLFSGKRATLCVCSLPTGMRVCRWHSMRVRVSGKEKSNKSGDISKFSYKINLTSQMGYYLNALDLPHVLYPSGNEPTETLSHLKQAIRIF